MLDGQSSRVTRVGGRCIEGTAVVEMLGNLLMSGGQGREKGHGQRGELHCECSDGFRKILILSLSFLDSS